MKRPMAYITAAWNGDEYETTKQAARYCREVYEAGYSPVCPMLYSLIKGNRQYAGSPFAFDWLPYISSPYGYRVHPFSGAKSFHSGADIALPEGTEILAGNDGVVMNAGNNGDYGLSVLIDYGDGVTVRYAHCSGLSVSAGQGVSKGQTVALVGNTGLSTGAHLHLEVMKDGETLNPLYFAVIPHGG